MTQIMTIMEDYLHYRGFQYLRLDGSTKVCGRMGSVMSCTLFTPWYRLMIDPICCTSSMHPIPPISSFCWVLELVVLVWTCKQPIRSSSLIRTGKLPIFVTQHDAYIFSKESTSGFAGSGSCPSYRSNQGSAHFPIDLYQFDRRKHSCSSQLQAWYWWQGYPGW